MKSSQDTFLPNLIKFFHILVDKFRETIHPDVKISFSKELESINIEDPHIIGEVQFYIRNLDWLELIESLLGPRLVPKENNDPRLIIEFLISQNRIAMKNPRRENEFYRNYQSSSGTEVAEYLILPQLYINQEGSDVWYSDFYWPIYYQKGAGYYFTNIHIGTPFKEIRYSAKKFRDWENVPLLSLCRDPNIQLLSTWYSDANEVVVFPRSSVSLVPTNPELQMVWGINISLTYRD